MNTERVLIIKLNEHIEGEQKLKERVSSAWKINLDTVYKKNITHVVAMYHQQVIADYTIDDQMGYYLTGDDAGRVWFNLKDYDGDQPLKGKTFDYKTANPATTKILSDLMELEVK
ncbi:MULTISPECIES: hypothetical protein [Leuconostoc]|uniref:Uncharacterized protein n=1 Tax=Leuconostoc citreum TaxID=33964 RepID=A0A098DPG3_LEUCI|nr:MULTISPECIES: hypothetical protein [Leuconostoc]MCT4379210.1 hypothetical protein [Leuconostoc falkenbergense]MDI6682163.1 hypothetical protein [Leuconostoc suionicum]CEF82707.1 Putative uncharacterized protein [Leuconostoc citreum]